MIFCAFCRPRASSLLRFLYVSTDFVSSCLYPFGLLALALMGASYVLRTVYARFGVCLWRLEFWDVNRAIDMDIDIG